MSTKQRIYPGIDEDAFGGMTDIGRIIRDAWVFELLPETEKCCGWDYGQLEALYDQVHREWQKYGHLASHLPEALRTRHRRIYDEAIAHAKNMGWEMDLKDEN